MRDIVPLFDSLTHVAPPETGAAVAQMRAHGILCAFTIGLPGMPDCQEASCAQIVRANTDRLLPVAFYDYDPHAPVAAIRAKLQGLRELGYLGIKLHPRMAKIDLSDEAPAMIIQEANALGLIVMLCTYFYSKEPPANSLEGLWQLLMKLEGAKLILMHGCTVRLLEAIELTRAFPNALLDLSFSLCKYAGSSLDADIAFAFQAFDQRICVGSDFPDFSFGLFRKRFDFFSRDIPREKCNNIAYKNLLTFTGMGGQFFES